MHDIGCPHNLGSLAGLEWMADQVHRMTYENPRGVGPAVTDIMNHTAAISSRLVLIEDQVRALLSGSALADELRALRTGEPQEDDHAAR